MSRHLSLDDARQSLSDHVAAKGAEIRAIYGPRIGWEELLRILEDRRFTRYPCRIVFGKGSLQPGEFAHPSPLGERPEDGFVICVHPLFAGRLDVVPHLVLYQLVRVNYGEFASPDDAETFGSSALGLSKDQYYEILCALADEVIAGSAEAPCRKSACCG